nr:MAG: putative RNA-dependent RNA polymerase [Narnaviridae sp.]
MAGNQEDVLSSINWGSLRNLESVFRDTTSVSRQTPNMEKFKERLLHVVPLSPVKGETRRMILLDLNRVQKAIQRASLSQSERRKLGGILKKSLSTEDGQERLRELIITLCDRGLSLPAIIGMTVGNRLVHFSSDLVRFRHALGLADAIHMAMFNTGIKVKFLARHSVRLTSSRWKEMDNHFGSCDLRQMRIKNKIPYMNLHRSTTKNRKFYLLQHYLGEIPSGRPEKEYVKLIKGSLVDAFCVAADQERPPLEFSQWISLFPPMAQSRLDNLFRNDRKGRVRFYKNLLESKSLCAEVGADMIEEAYVKHRLSLCRPESEVLLSSDGLAEKLYQYGVKVGQRLRELYRPFETKLPNTRATMEKGRDKGGAREALKDRIEVQKGPLYNQFLAGATRLEPTVVGLFGAPGSGKTSLLPGLIRFLGTTLFPGMEGEKLVYSRSCACEHWDGYEGQPIVVLDDLGQNPNNRSDLVEFEQLVSSNRYILPMAELKEKGTKFTSPIIIATSNLGYNSLLTEGSQFALEDDGAFWRRFHLPIICRKRQGKAEYGLARSRADVTQHRFYNQGDQITYRQETAYPSHFRNRSIHRFGVSGNHSTPHEPYSIDEIFDDRLDLFEKIVSVFRHRVDFHASHLSGYWRQDITCFHASVHQGPGPFYDFSMEKRKVAWLPSDVTASILFEETPPFHRPIVQAIAIPEPLKVRMITKAEAETKVLQPFQRALFDYLGENPQFVLTHGITRVEFEEDFLKRLSWVERIESEIMKIRDRFPGEDHLWLSGDYSAATDNFPFFVTQALVEGILSQIDHDPTKAWVRYETSAHRIRYPGGIIADQTSGQLMGSLISFPLLCFLNDFIIRESGFEVGSYLINGDDVVAKGTSASISHWRNLAPKVGLELSLGKNFIDADFCCVNSQLFWRGEVQHTGKVSCQTRYGKTLSRCFCETQFYFGASEEIKAEFIRRNIIPLRETPRSLDVPVSHGGLALFFSSSPDVDIPLAKRVYLSDYLSDSLRSLPVPGYDFIRAMKIPLGFFTPEEIELGGGEAEENGWYSILQSLDLNPKESESRELTHSMLLKREKTYEVEGNRRLLNQIRSSNFREFPPLSNVQTKIVFVQKGKVGYVKQKLVENALRILLSEIRKESGPTGDEYLLDLIRDAVSAPDPIFEEGFPFSLEEEALESDEDEPLPHTSNLIRGGIYLPNVEYSPVESIISTLARSLDRGGDQRENFSDPPEDDR